MRAYSRIVFCLPYDYMRLTERKGRNGYQEVAKEGALAEEI
jgi:hypothetical protein